MKKILSIIFIIFIIINSIFPFNVIHADDEIEATTNKEEQIQEVVDETSNNNEEDNLEIDDFNYEEENNDYNEDSNQKEILIIEEEIEEPEQTQEITGLLENNILTTPQDRQILEQGSCNALGFGKATYTVYDDYSMVITGRGDLYSSYDAPTTSYDHMIKHIEIEDGITSIGKYLFYNFYSLVSITIPNSVKVIGESAFKNCLSLKEIDIPNSVTLINYSVFSGCTSLTTITIPDSVLEIRDGAFRNCSSLKNIILPNSITCIDFNVFYGCTSLEQITIPNSVTNIYSDSFGNCESLLSVFIPDSVISIGENAFSNCFSLKTITLSNNISTIGNKAFSHCSSLISINIPNKLTKLSNQLFSNCSSLKTIVIPKSVTSIGDCAFVSSGIKDIYYYGSEEDWNKIEVLNTAFNDTQNVVIHYNYDGGFDDNQKDYSINTDSYYSNTNHKLFNIIEKGNSVSNGFNIKINNDVYKSDNIQHSLMDTIKVKCNSDDNATIYKDGFHSFTMPYYLIGDNNYVVMYRDSIKDPFVQTLLIDKSVGDQRSFNNILVNDETLYVASYENKNVNALIKIYPMVNWNGHGEGSVWLEQDGKKIDLFNNMAKTLALSQCDFKANETIYLCAKAKDGTQIKEKTKIHVYKKNKNEIDFSFGDNYELDVENSRADILNQLTNEELKLSFKNIEHIPLSYTVKEDGSVIGTIGIEVAKAEDKEAVYKATKNMLDLAKRESTTVFSKEMSNKLKELKRFGSPISSTGEIGVKGDIQVIGYLKGKLNDDGIPYFNNVELLVTYEAGINYTFNTTIVTIPAYFKTELKAKLNYLLSCVYNANEQEILPSPKADMDLILSLSVEAGPGWEGFFSGGVKGTGNIKLHSELPQKDYSNRWSVYGDFAFVGTLAGISGEWKIAKTDEMIFREDGQWCWKESNGNALSFVPNRDRITLEVDNNDGSLFTGVSGYCAPSIIDLPNDKLLAVWISDVETRKLVDKNGLYYSIYDGDQWSSPILVYDDGTNDSVPQLYEEEGTIYLAWQNYEDIFDMDDFPEYDIISEQNKIVYSIFNIEENSWAAPEQYIDDWYLCESIIPDSFDKDIPDSTTPIKVLNNYDLTAIIYTSLDEEDHNQIYGIMNDGINWGSPIALTDLNEGVNNYSAIINNDGNITLLYSSGDPSNSSLYIKNNCVEHNLVLKNVDYVEETLVPNNELSLRLGIENEGIKTVNGVNVSLLINGTEVKNEDILVRFDSGEYDIIYVNYLLSNEISFDNIDVVINPIDNDDENLDDNNGTCLLRKKDISIDDISSIKEENSDNTHVVIKVANRGQTELEPTSLSLYKDKGEEKELIKTMNVPLIEINDAVFIEDDIDGLEDGEYIYAEIEDLGNENIVGNNSNFTIVRLKDSFKKTYSITYHNVPEDILNDNVTSYDPGESYTFFGLERLGYTFLGWYSQNGIETGQWGTKVTSISSKSKGDIDLYARWQLYSYTITYKNVDNCDNSLNPSTYTIEDEIVLEDALGSYYKFAGWYTDSSLADGFKIDAIPINSSGDIILYAKWSNDLKLQTNNPTIDTYKPDEGCEYMTVNKGTRVSITCDTPRSIVYFTTDNTNPAISIDNLYKDAIVVNENLTIKALSVAVDDNGNQIMKPSNIVVYNYHIKEESSDVIENIFDRQYYNNNLEKCIDLWMTDIDFEAVESSKPIIYTGKAITPSFRVYDHTTLLKQGVDYTVKYSNNVNASVDKDNNIITTKLPTIIITGKGNYTGSITTHFTIKPVDINPIITMTDVYSYNTKGQAISLKVANGSTTLKMNKDYIYTIDGQQSSKIYEVGSYPLLIKGIGNYNFEIEKQVTMLPKETNVLPMSKLSISLSQSKYVCDGERKEPTVVIKQGKNILDSNLFTFDYNNCVNAGIATVTVTSNCADYSGSITKTYTIEGTPLSKAKFLLNGDSFKSLPTQTYDGLEKNISGISLYYVPNSKEPLNSIPLTKDVDYTLTYQNNIDKGTATMIFTGINKYTGTVKKTFKIVALPIDNHSIDIQDIIPDQAYLKGGNKPDVCIINTNTGDQLLLNKDYTLSYKNNTAVNDNTDFKKMTSVTIKGKGNYSGSTILYFKITPQDISKMSILVPDKVYQKKAGIYKSTPTILDIDGKKLVSNKDYDKNIIYTYEYDTVVTNIINKKEVSVFRQQGSLVDSKDIIPVNTAIRVTITGIKNYETYIGAGTPNTISTIYSIIPNDISKATVKISTQYYTGKPIYLVKDNTKLNGIIITYGSGKNKTSLSSIDYDIISYSNNINKGTASVTIKGKGNYGGTKTIKFTIASKTMKLTTFFNKNIDLTTGTIKDMHVNKTIKLTDNAFKRSRYNFVVGR